MRLGLNFGYWGRTPVDNLPLAQEADRLGHHSIWAAGTWGSTAASPLTWLAVKTERIAVGTAVMQMTARTPANSAIRTVAELVL